MKLRKQSLTLSLIGLALGLVSGYLYVDHFNRVGPTAATPVNQQPTEQLPPDHPALSQINPQEIAALKKNAEDNPNDFNAQTAAARILYQANQLSEAADFYARAHRLQPDDHDTIVQLGNSHFDIGLQEIQQDPDHSSKHFLEAAQWYEQALETNPNEVNVRTDYGLTFYYRQPQNLDQAIAQYRQSLQIQPAHPQTLSNLSTALAEKGEISQAKDVLSQLEQSSPDPGLLGQSLYNFTRAMVEQQKWEQANRTLTRLEQLFPNVPEVKELRKTIDEPRGTKIRSH